MDANAAMRRVAIASAVATVIATSFAYTGTVTTRAFLGFVLISAIGVGLVTALIGQPRQLGALIAGLGSALLWSVAVNALSGETSGPVARSSFVCGASTAIAVYSARRLWVATFLGAVGLELAGALYYGAAGEVRAVALISVLVSLLTTALLEASRHRRRLRLPGFGMAIAAFVVAATLVAAAVAVQSALSTSVDSRRAVTSRLVDPSAIRPPWAPAQTSDPERTTLAPTSTANPASSTATNQPATATSLKPTTTTVHRDQQKQRKHDRNLALIITLIVLAALVLLVGGRLTLGAYRLRRWRRRLQRLAPQESAAACWRWMLFHLSRLGWVVSDNPSIDQTADDVSRLGWPAELRQHVCEVANRGATAAFTRSSVGADDAERSWEVARLAIRTAHARTARWRRAKAILWLLRT